MIYLEELMDVDEDVIDRRQTTSFFFASEQYLTNCADILEELEGE